ncbi:hypothetical protein [Neorhizobium sp. JUb45]|uniref:hypothetical protein n=1 Tax=Neorhizobium sp. JUb45 TaxID=2485113 RepID=UPI001050D1A1|nr:hypothetical protein [Neorhizobium sp. JUb45]
MQFLLGAKYSSCVIKRHLTAFFTAAAYIEVEAMEHVELGERRHPSRRFATGKADEKSSVGTHEHLPFDRAPRIVLTSNGGKT